jgi:hypothetical protein
VIADEIKMNSTGGKIEHTKNRSLAINLFRFGDGEMN